MTIAHRRAVDGYGQRPPPSGRAGPPPPEECGPGGSGEACCPFPVSTGGHYARSSDPPAIRIVHSRHLTGPLPEGLAQRHRARCGRLGDRRERHGLAGPDLGVGRRHPRSWRRARRARDPRSAEQGHLVPLAMPSGRGGRRATHARCRRRRRSAPALPMGCAEEPRRRNIFPKIKICYIF